MGLVRNLKKTLTNMAERVLVELSYHYIKQRAKLTSKRRDNSSRITYSQSPLTTESQCSTIATSLTGTSEKIIMETAIEPVVQVRDWAIDRIHELSEYDIEAAHSIQSEFSEWLNPDIENHDIFSLEYIGD